MKKHLAALVASLAAYYRCIADGRAIEAEQHRAACSKALDELRIILAWRID